MSHMLSWLDSHYVKIAEYLLASLVLLVTAVLGTALPLQGLAARWPRRLAAIIGLALILLGGALAIGKAVKPELLRHLPWVAPVITALLGILFVIVVWLIGMLYWRKTHQRLQPMAEAAWRTIPNTPGENQSTIKLHTSEGGPIVDEVLAQVRKPSSGLLFITATTGAGKSWTLTAIAARCKAEWRESRRGNIIPIYVDIARFAQLTPKPPLREYILSQIGHDAEFTHQVNEAWKDTRTRVSWLFLFDNVERALTRWSPDSTYSWRAELADFVNTNPARFRAVLAGRNLPSISGNRIDLSSLNVRARTDFLTMRGVTAAQQATLGHEESFRPYVDNLGWLDLVSAYLAQVPERTPTTFYELMGDVLSERIATVLSAQAEFNEGQIEAVASEVAVQIFKSSGHIEIRRNGLVGQISEIHSLDRKSVQLILDELLRHDMLVSYLRGEDEYLAFRSASVYSYYLTESLLTGNATPFIDELLTDFSHTVVAISLLQYGPDELIEEILKAVQSRLGPPEPTPEASTIIVNRMLTSVQMAARIGVIEGQSSGRWTQDDYHLLYILVAGLSRQPSAIPERLREVTDLLLAGAFSSATPRMVQQMLDVNALAHEDVASACCAKGLRSDSGRLLVSSARQVMSRRETFDLLPVKDQMRVMIMAFLIGTDSWISQHTEPAYSQRLRLASYVGIILGPLFFIGFGISSIVSAVQQPNTSGFSLLLLGFIGAITCGVILARRRPEDLTQWMAVWLLLAIIVLVGAAFIGTLAIVGAIVGMSTGHLNGLLTLLTAYTLLWPICALYYLVVDRAPTLLRFGFPFVVISVPLWSLVRIHQPAVAAWPSKRQVVKAFRACIVVACLFLIVQVTSKGWHFDNLTSTKNGDLRNTIVWTAVTVIALAILIVPFIDWIRDLRWIGEWKRSGSESKGDNVLLWISSLQTVWGAKRLLTVLTRREPTPSAVPLLPSLVDFAGALEWVKDLGPPKITPMSVDVLATIPAYFSSDVRNWIKDYDRLHPRGLYKIASQQSVAVNDYVVAVEQLASISSPPSTAVP